MMLPLQKNVGNLFFCLTKEILSCKKYLILLGKLLGIFICRLGKTQIK